MLKEYLRQLLPGKNLRRKNLPLVTSLLSLLDYSISTGQSILAGRSKEENRQARELLERAILEVIGDDSAFSDGEEASLGHFSSFLRSLQTRNANSPLGVITTNYDMASDLATFEAANVPKDEENYWCAATIASRIDFGFAWSDTEQIRIKRYQRPSSPLYQLYKLHGSTNWLRCPLCDNVYVNPWGAIWDLAYGSYASSINECHCSNTRLEAQIVSPSFVREMREPNLLAVWKNALDVLRSADDWIIIGYSFPDEDLGVRALFTRAYAAHERSPRLTVIQRDDAAFNRYDAFFDSDRLHYCVGGLRPFLKHWR